MFSQLLLYILRPLIKIHRFTKLEQQIATLLQTSIASLTEAKFVEVLGTPRRTLTNCWISNTTCRTAPGMWAMPLCEEGREDHRFVEQAP